MPQSFRESLNQMASGENLDASTDEVFRTMLGVECERMAETVPTILDRLPAELVTAVVGFGGMLSGACVFRCDGKSAMAIAACMTGTAQSTVDETVKDGIGEICNMLAGAWKGRVPGLAAGCGLSLPAVITGSDYRIHVQAPEFQVERSYRFDDAVFSLTIICDGLQ